MDLKNIYKKLVLLFTGGTTFFFFLEIFFYLPNLVFPFNLWFIIILLITTFSFYYFLKDNKIFIVLSSVHTAIVGLIFYIIFLILSGIIPQVENNTFLSTIGLTHIVKSYPFALLTLVLIINLLLAIWKRIFMPLTLKNITFLINHLGILIVLMFASLAAFDLIRTTMYIEKNKVIWYAFKDNKEVVELPFAIELKDFRIDYFEPNVQLLKIKNISKNELDLITQHSITEKSFKLKNIDVKINKVIPYAWFLQDTIVSQYSPGYTKAVHATISLDNKTIDTWLSYPTFAQNARYVRIKDYIIILSTPQPKKYVSDVKIYDKSGKIYDDSILVNHPLDIYGWKIYQKDYDQNLGEFSNISILEVNHDRWLPIIYFGIFMMIIGSIFLLITSRR